MLIKASEAQGSAISTHLNPDEQVLAHVKREVSRRGVDSLDEMKRLALSALRRIRKLPSLVRAFVPVARMHVHVYRLYFLES